METHTVHNVNEGYFNTWSGKKPKILNPTVDDIDILDISRGLANICRFGGQIKSFYSVAQHSIMVANMAPYELRKAGLLHDATEAYLGDVIKPLKVILGNAYTEIEDKWEAVICEKFQIHPSHLIAIKQYDRRAVEQEYEYFFNGDENNVYFRTNPPLNPLAAFISYRDALNSLTDVR